MLPAADLARAPFPALRVGYDAVFVRHAALRSIVDVSATACVVATVHPGNTAMKPDRLPWCTPVPLDEVARVLGDDYRTYAA